MGRGKEGEERREEEGRKLRKDIDTHPEHWAENDTEVHCTRVN